MAKHRNDGLRKVCGCARRKWSSCAHPWHFSFQWRGVHYRFSLDKHLGRALKGKTEAENEAERIRTAIRDGEFGLPKPKLEMTVRELADEYLRRYVEVRRSARATVFRGALRVSLYTPVMHPTQGALALGAWPVVDVVSDTIEQFREARLTAGKGIPGTNRYLGYLRALWAWALRHDHATSTPFRRHGEVVVKLDTKAEHARTRRLEAGEERGLLDAAASHLYAVLVAAIETGMRRGEILSLQWKQVEGQRVERQGDQWIVIWSPKAEIFLPYAKTKSKRDRRIPISTRLRAVLEMRRLDAAGEPQAPECYVFGTEIGTRVREVGRAWRTAVLKAHGHKPAFTAKNDFSAESKAALRQIDLHFHDLRREAGSRWLEGGVPLHTIQRWLGHANISQTSTYLAVTDAGSHEAMAKFDRARVTAPPAATPDEVDADVPSENLQESCKEDGGKWSGRLDSNQRHLAPKPDQDDGT